MFQVLASKDLFSAPTVLVSLIVNYCFASTTIRRLINMHSTSSVMLHCTLAKGGPIFKEKLPQNSHSNATELKSGIIALLIWQTCSQIE